MLSNLKKGDYVITAGGLYGVITGLSDNTLNIEIAPKVKVKISRNSVSGVVGKKSQ
jgi:preprotein translocase subunit YajC